MALSVTVIDPVLETAAVGVNVTLIAQEAPPARLDPQPLVWEKVPLAAMPEMARVAPPELVRVTVCAVLVVPTSCAGKFRDEGERLAIGVVPIPERLTV